ncbi:dTDP-4-dehydrorhamnose reductase [Methermicoccus shengliensis]|nr:dTDP-4-dehydrorhamnose reductase [Methermicoccus shengliensis]KUK04385.1 MAG: dTDP-4-dehydrorhamnose reductase [Euryarchaeota archaeon 55_53]KUK30196.1 MAG: dTDP-4-dehydrorhamnose reductase [Methanosarcinales archeaon 56_1174]MDI3488588.1 dTDP-4-dehydrorhamnose reductase [Methanosarcinales archaeon]MDN5295756.1 dTDP-4-dehydrorhamnose reductase [Methanosarcinales archaeon]
MFVTGGSGLLGNKIAEIALERGYDVYSGYCNHKPEFGKAVKFDLTDANSIVRAINDVKPDVIIHTAALTDVDRCEVDKDLAYKINVEGTKIIAEMARKFNSFLIYISTDYVFDGNKGLYKEEDETNPVNYYGYTKLLGEKYCQDFCIARTCVIYGAKPASGKVNFALWLINKLENGESVRIVIDQYITPTLNTNLARMLLEIAERKITGIFHLAGATRVSRFEFVKEIARVFGLDESLIIPSRMDEINWIAKRPRDSSLDTSKATKYLNERPYTLSRALKILKEEVV